jgi:hypothetical protein
MPDKGQSPAFNPRFTKFQQPFPGVLPETHVKPVSRQTKTAETLASQNGVGGAGVS